MLNDHDLIKMIFGFKVRYLRQQQNLSYKQLAEQTGLSTSYLHDIEKGRKYPKVSKITALADALDVSYDFLVSMQASKKLQPIVDLLTSDFLKQFPLDFFGISAEKLFELFSTAPDRVNAFIRTIFKVTRSYQLERENIYQAALRSYQDMFDNYFPDVEQAVHQFKEDVVFPKDFPCPTTNLEKVLHDSFDIRVDRTLLASEPALKDRRSYFRRSDRTLLLNHGLQSAQENFLLGREAGFQYMQLHPRPYLTRMHTSNQFDVLLHNFKASYFSVALLMDEHRLASDFSNILGQSVWEPTFIANLLKTYDVTPEMLFQRLTNVLPHHLGIRDLFFLRMTREGPKQDARMTKELHLSQLHNPYANESQEHYCRRWISVTILGNLHRSKINPEEVMIGAQISSYQGTDKRYLCISVAKNTPNPVSVTLGILINEQARKHIRFLESPEINSRVVHTTCEHCPITDCRERVAPPVVLQQQEQLLKEQVALQRLEH